jgi:hypothetical protein
MRETSADVSELLISEEAFQAWLERHAPATASGITIVAEDNSQMTGTYAMLDARGRFFSNATGAHVYGPSGFEVGFQQAWDAVAGDGFDAEGFRERGGAYEWSAGAASAAGAADGHICRLTPTSSLFNVMLVSAAACATLCCFMLCLILVLTRCRASQEMDGGSGGLRSSTLCDSGGCHKLLKASHATPLA